jgi:WD40 repeat protein
MGLRFKELLIAVGTNEWRKRLVLAMLCVLCGLSGTEAQRKRAPGIVTGFDDVPFAISFSPDGRCLAIARGAGEPSQRFGRIELWDTETGNLRRVIKGFDGPVKSISFSPDGQTLVSGSNEYHVAKIQEKASERNGTIVAELKWWNTQTGELNHSLTLPGEGSTYLQALYSPDGKELAVVAGFRETSWLTSSPPFGPGTGINGPLEPLRGEFPRVYYRTEFKLLDAQTGEPKVKLSTNPPGRMLFSPDGKLMAVDNGSEIKVREAQSGADVHKLKDLKGHLTAMTFSPDSQTFVVAITKYDREYSKNYIKYIGKSEVRLFDVHSWKLTRKFQNLGAVNSLIFEPSGRGLLVGGMISGREGAIPAVKIIDLLGGTAGYFPTGGTDYNEAVDFMALSANGGLLAFRTGDTVQLVNTRTWRVTQTWDANSVGEAVERPASRFLLSVKRVLAVAFSADSRTLSGETDQGEIKSWDSRTGEIKNQVSASQDDPTIVAVSADGRTFAEVSNGQLLVWDSVQKKNIPLPRGHSISAVALAADGRTVAIGDEHDVSVLGIGGDGARTLSGANGAVNRLVFSDDGHSLAGAEADGVIDIWNVASGQVEKRIATHNEITALRFSPNGQLLATASQDHSITLWNARTGLAQERLQKHEAAINALAFSADGQLLASGGDDRMVVLWEVASGKSKRILKGHDQTVTSVAFSSDGQFLASGSGNASVVLWEVKTGKLSRVLK